MLGRVLAAWVLLAAAASEPVSLGAPGLELINIDAKLSGFYTDHLSQQLVASGLKVYYSREIATLLGLERQKQQLHCGENESSCAAELANALGTDAVLVGDIARFGEKTYQVNLKVLSAANAQTLATFSSRVDGDVPLLDELTRGAALLAEQTQAKLGRPGADAIAIGPAATGGGLRRMWWASVAAGALFAGAGAVFFSQAGGRHPALDPHG